MMARKILLSIAVFAIACLAASHSAAAAYASLSVTHYTIPSSIGPGDSGNIVLTFSNTGSDYARAIELTMKASTYAEYGKTVYQVGTVSPGGSAQVTVPIKIKDTVSESSVALPFSVKYYEGQASTYTTISNFVAFDIDQRSIVKIGEVSYDKDVITPGSVVEMSVAIDNIGKTGIKDVVVSIDSSDVPLVPLDGDSESYLGNIAIGSSKIAKFSVAIDRNADISAYSIPLAVSYYDEAGVSHSDQKYVGMAISGEPEFVIALETDGGIYSYYQSDITISVANRGTGSAEALTLIFGYENSSLPVTPNQYYIGSLDKDDFDTVSVSLNTKSALPGNYELPVTIVYRDVYNNEYTLEESLTLKVEDIPPVEIPAWMQIAGLVVIAVLIYWKRKSVSKIFARIFKK